MITLFYAGVLGILMSVLSIRVAFARQATQVGWGDGGDPTLSTRIRVFGNFIEYVPMILLLMLVIEMQNGAALFLYVVGTALIVFRLIHAAVLRVEMTASWHRSGRAVAALGTWFVLLASAVYATWLGLAVF